MNPVCDVVLFVADNSEVSELSTTFANSIISSLPSLPSIEKPKRAKIIKARAKNDVL